MNPAHVHLLLNHIPVVGIWLGIALYLVALVRKPEWRSLSLGVFALMAVLTIPAYLSGEPAEEMIHGLPGVSEATVEAHEEAAVPALIAMLVLGAVAAGGLMRFRAAASWPRGYGWIVLILALIAGGADRPDGESRGAHSASGDSLDHTGRSGGIGRDSRVRGTGVPMTCVVRHARPHTCSSTISPSSRT